MATLDIPKAYLDAAPVIVTSPTTRCGTTLVQRLLSASDNAFIYGEEIGSQFRALATLFSQQINASERLGDIRDASFYLALAGALREWRPDLTAPAQVVLNGWTHTFYQLPVALAGFGQTIQRPVWGFKWPACPPDLLRAYLVLMPNTKVVYVVRNLVDALKSAKARRFVNSADDAAGFCAEWARNMAILDELAGDPRLLVVRYEALIEDRAGQSARLAAFTGAEGLNLSEFDLKLNTFTGVEDEGRSPTQYIAPGVLSPDDLEALGAAAGEAMARHYPGLAFA